MGVFKLIINISNKSTDEKKNTASVIIGINTDIRIMQ